jgi:hypothetical protein
MIVTEKSRLVLDVNVWLDAIGPLAALSHWEELSEIESNGVSANAARSVRGLVRSQIKQENNRVSVCASAHILDLLFEKLQSEYGWARSVAAIAVSQVSSFCEVTGGSYNVDTRTDLPTVNSAISSTFLVKRQNQVEADIDFEDIIVLTTAIAAKAKFLVTNDGGLQQTHALMYRKFDLAVIFPKQLVAAMGRNA